VSRAEIEAADWSLTPGRYVGVAAVAEDEDFDFSLSIAEIRDEISELDQRAIALAVRIDGFLADLVA